MAKKLSLAVLEKQIEETSREAMAEVKGGKGPILDIPPFDECMDVCGYLVVLSAQFMMNNTQN